MFNKIGMVKIKKVIKQYKLGGASNRILDMIKNLLIFFKFILNLIYCAQISIKVTGFIFIMINQIKYTQDLIIQ